MGMSDRFQAVLTTAGTAVATIGVALAAFAQLAGGNPYYGAAVAVIGLIALGIKELKGAAADPEVQAKIDDLQRQIANIKAGNP